MFITYIIIGSVLTIIGLISAVYFLNYLRTKKFNQTTIDSFLDAFVTIVIGICYLYCACILSENESPIETTFHFNSTQNIDDIAIMLNNSSEEDTTETVLPTSDEFLKNYQKFFEDIIKQKQQNASWHNKTIYFNNKQYRDVNPRRKRALPDDFTGNFEEYLKTRCFTRNFIENALMLYSFLHCLLSLINKTILCKKCNEKTVKNSETKLESIETSSDSWTAEPIVEMFKAKSAANTSVQQEPPKPTVSKEAWILPLFSVIFTLLFPIITIIILYSIMRVPEHVENSTLFPDFNFNNTRIDGNILKVINSPVNVSHQHLKQKEIKQVVDNVYDIVHRAQETAEIDQQLRAPIMYDIVYYLNNHTNSMEDCSQLAITVKCYFFIINVLVYFLTVLYAKSVQIRVRMENNPKANTLNMSIMSMAILWFPSAMETYYRTNLQQTNGNVITDLCLAIGNGNRIVTLARNYVDAKMGMKNGKFVQPVP